MCRCGSAWCRRLISPHSRTFMRWCRRMCSSASLTRLASCSIHWRMVRRSAARCRWKSSGLLFMGSPQGIPGGPVPAWRMRHARGPGEGAMQAWDLPGAGPGQREAFPCLARGPDPGAPSQSPQRTCPAGTSWRSTAPRSAGKPRSEEHTSELQSLS